MEKINLSKSTKDILNKREGKKIVFTNGCFDLLHRGHLSYLADAAALGDYLIVGLNSDESVSGLKGPSRPISNQEDRKFFLESLKSVASVEVFYDETPLALIESISPDVLVKGGDYQIDNIVGKDHVFSKGGEVLTIPFIDGYSSTKLIEKIVQSGQ